MYRVRSGRALAALTAVTLLASACSSAATTAPPAAPASAAAPAAPASVAPASSPAAVASAAASAVANAAASALPGFANGQHPMPASCKSPQPILGVLLPNTVNPYYVAMRQSFIDNGTKAGFKVDVQIALDSSAQQLSQAQALVQEGICVAALNGVDSAPAAAVVKIFNNAGIPVFTTNVIVSTPDLVKQGGFIIDYVGADQVEGGTAMAKMVLQDLGATAKIVYGSIGDPEQIPTEQRDSGFKAVMQTDPNATYVGVVNSKVDPTVALQVTTDMLQGHPDINVLWADTGPSALGALRAIQALGKQNSVKLYAFCAASVAMTGPYVGCAAQQPALYAQMVVQEIGKYLQGQTVQQQILVPLKLYHGGTPPPGEVG